MPYKSDAQRRYFNANREKLESEGVDVGEWNETSKGKKLPEKVSVAHIVGQMIKRSRRYSSGRAGARAMLDADRNLLQRTPAADVARLRGKGLLSGPGQRPRPSRSGSTRHYGSRPRRNPANTPRGQEALAVMRRMNDIRREGGTPSMGFRDAVAAYRSGTPLDQIVAKPAAPAPAPTPTPASTPLPPNPDPKSPLGESVGARMAQAPSHTTPGMTPTPSPAIKQPGAQTPATTTAQPPAPSTQEPKGLGVPDYVAAAGTDPMPGMQPTMQRNPAAPNLGDLAAKGTWPPPPEQDQPSPASPNHTTPTPPMASTPSPAVKQPGTPAPAPTQAQMPPAQPPAKPPAPQTLAASPAPAPRAPAPPMRKQPMPSMPGGGSFGLAAPKPPGPAAGALPKPMGGMPGGMTGGMKIPKPGGNPMGGMKMGSVRDWGQQIGGTIHETLPNSTEPTTQNTIPDIPVTAGHTEGTSNGVGAKTAMTKRSIATELGAIIGALKARKENKLRGAGYGAGVGFGTDIGAGAGGALGAAVGSGLGSVAGHPTLGALLGGALGAGGGGYAGYRAGQEVAKDVAGDKGLPWDKQKV